MLETGALTIPDTVRDLTSFRRWVHQASFPEKSRTWWMRKEVWIDMSKEQVFTHNLVRTAVTSELYNLVNRLDLGLLLSDGVLFTNREADLSGNPDLLFISYDSREQERVELIEGKFRGYTEIIGSPDMVLEVVSDSSEEKDVVVLFEDYFTAGIREYWRVDARESPISFEIFKRNSKGFVAARKQAGWLKSAVFGKAFRMVESKDRLGDPKYLLEVR